MRLKLIIAYDGGPFLGWQSQAGGNTVQDHLETAFKKICGTRVVVHGSGRTDAGVHALAQCAHAEAEHPRFAPGDWLPPLNAHLPGKIRVLKCARAKADFHARFSARGKIYTYRIWNHPVHSPFELGRVWHLPGELDRKLLQTRADELCGTHDFAAFAANRGHSIGNTVRTIRSIKIRQRGPLITLIFEGDGFLYKMVRLMTGTLMRCAQHRAGPDWIPELLEHKKKTSCRARRRTLPD